ncbi:MAG: formylglycine-generating enzyme family protein [Verrucomicrobiota bacterium]
MKSEQTKITGWLVVALVLLGGVICPSAQTVTPLSPTGMALIPQGIYTPPFRKVSATNQIPVEEFYLDICPITNENFLEFVRANPKWRRSQVNHAAADELYLKHWSGDLQFDIKIKNAPVTFVSYYAAKAYAQWRDKRLPTVAEWEYAATSSPTRADGKNDAAFQKQILAWYSSPSPETLPDVGSNRANIFGVQDLHGLVWEWTGDFYKALGMAEAVCGAGAKDAKDRGDYPAFMRFGFRSTLQMDYTVHNLGFRCAKNLSKVAN